MNTPPLSLYRKIASGFVLLTVILVFVIFYYSLTYAYITITPTVQDIDFDFNALIVQDQQDVSKGTFAGTLVDQEMQAQDTFAATGVRTVTTGLEGRVVVINNYSRTQPLIATTRLLTEQEELFRIAENIQVAPGGRVEVDFYADDPAAGASLEVGDRLTIPGLFVDLQEFIYAEVIAVDAGEEQNIAYVTKEDLDAAAESLEARVREQVASAAGDGRQAVLESELLSREFSHLAGDESENFTATIRTRVTGAVFEREPVLTYARQLLESTISPDQQLHGLGAEEVVFQVDMFDEENKLVQLSGSVSSGVILRKNSAALDKSKLVKLKGDEAVGYLENLPEVASAKVEFFPFWVKSIPSFPDHIIISIEQ